MRSIELHEKFLFRRMVLAGLLALSLSRSERSACAESEFVADWDKALPSMALHDIRLECKSLGDAWMQVGQRFLLRSVLFSRAGEAWSPQTFSFNSQLCQASQLLDALVATYSNTIWSQDSESGVIWIHPADVPYHDILSRKVNLSSDYLGVPMQDGVLGSISRATDGEVFAQPYDAAFRNTFDYAVDLSSGTYTIRDILNRCCTADPTVTLSINARMNGTRKSTYLQTVHLIRGDYRSDPPTPGALELWRLGVRPVDASGPTIDVIRQKLADRNPRIRLAARHYLKTGIYHFDVEGHTVRSMDPQSEAWALLAGADILFRLERPDSGDSAYSQTIERLRALASEDALGTWPANLSVLLAMELARLGHDTHYLEVIARRDFKPGELADMKSRLFAIARMSPEVREKLGGELGQKLLAADPSFAFLKDVRPNPRSFGPRPSPKDAVPVVEFKPHEPTQSAPN